MNIAKLDKIPADFARNNCISKACELLEVMGLNAMSREIKEGKQTVVTTCKYLLKCRGESEKRKELISALLEISLKCNI